MQSFQLTGRLSFVNDHSPRVLRMNGNQKACPSKQRVDPDLKHLAQAFP
jgi:hypothetical protein